MVVVFRDSTTIQFANSGAHAAGSVDIIVTNPGGLAATLARGYTYSTGDAFDANGEWIAHTDGHNDYVTDMRFTVKNNTLVSLSCGTPVTMPTTLSMQNGAFSFEGADGLTMSGMLASTTTSYGQVNAPGCGDGRVVGGQGAIALVLAGTAPNGRAALHWLHAAVFHLRRGESAPRQTRRWSRRLHCARGTTSNSVSPFILTSVQNALGYEGLLTGSPPGST